tara:strand:- start:9304 stop:10506 length:1203 start_codon:yes stop_codon:yes gene_type:complete
MIQSHQQNDKDLLFTPAGLTAEASVLTPSDRYVNRNKFAKVFGVPKFWPSKKWVHLIHNWRTGGSSLTALLSVNIHDSYLKVGHPFTRDGWPVDYSLTPLQITSANQLKEWIDVQPTPGVLAGHTYAGMPNALGVKSYDQWVTLREPAARLNSGLLRFHRIPLKSSNPDGGYVGNTQGHDFSSSKEVEKVTRNKLSHELNGMTRRLAGYNVLSQGTTVDHNLEVCKEIDESPITQSTFDLAVDRLKATKWIYLTDMVIPSLLLLESEYELKPFIHPCSNLKHNPQWNGGGITRLQESLLSAHRPLFEHLNEWDVKLYAIAQKLFWQKWKSADIDVDRLKARNILQSDFLLHPKFIDKNDFKSLKTFAEKQLNKRLSKCDSKSVKRWVESDFYNSNFWKTT